MKLEVLPDAEAASLRGARLVAEVARAAVAARGRFLLAVSGGGGPDRMFRLFADEDVPWEKVHVFQVDERVAPGGHAERNLTHLEASLLAHAPIRRAQVHPMPVEARDLAAACARYAAALRAVAGDPPVLDLAQLGIGSDGHTASLVPGDPALEVKDAAVTTSGPYEGRLRMTLTYPVLDATRTLVWLVTKAERADALARLVAGDAAIPAGRVRRDGAIVVASAAAAAKTGARPAGWPGAGS